MTQILPLLTEPSVLKHLAISMHCLTCRRSNCSNMWNGRHGALALGWVQWLKKFPKDWSIMQSRSYSCSMGSWHAMKVGREGSRRGIGKAPPINAFREVLLFLLKWSDIYKKLLNSSKAEVTAWQWLLQCKNAGINAHLKHDLSSPWLKS